MYSNALHYISSESGIEINISNLLAHWASVI